MKKLLLSVFALSCSMAIAAAPKVSWKGYIKTIMESGEGTNGFSRSPVLSSRRGRGPKIGVVNSRIAANATMNRAFGNVQFDFANGEGDDFQLKHAFAGYMFSNTTKLQAGRFKTPIGIDHSLPNSQLDIVEENALTAHLTQGYKNGLMLSGDLIGNLSYNIAYLTVDNQDFRGTDEGYAARLMLDHGNFHVEAAMGIQEGNDITVPAARSTRDFTTIALGISYESYSWIFKSEYIKGSNVRLSEANQLVNDTYDMTTIYYHAGLELRKDMELVVRHYMSSAESTVSNFDADLTNTYFGINLMLEKDFLFKVNYVMVGGDDISATSPFPAIPNAGNNGIAGASRMANAFFVLGQIMF